MSLVPLFRSAELAPVIFHLESVVEDEYELQVVLLDPAEVRLSSWDDLVAGLEKVGGESKRRKRMGGCDDLEGAAGELAKVNDVVSIDRGAEQDDRAVVEPGERLSAPNEREEGGRAAVRCEGNPAAVLVFGAVGALGSVEVAERAEWVLLAALSCRERLELRGGE